MNVTVPVAARLKSPLRRTAPTASPARNCLDAAEADVAALVIAEPLGTATKPMASRYFENRAIVSGAKLDMDSGTAIGFAPVIVLAGDAAAKPSSSFSKRSLVFPFANALRNSEALTRGVAATTADEVARPRSAIFSISSMGVMPATGSLANCHE